MPRTRPKQSLADYAYDWLYEQISGFGYQAGEVLLEEEIARNLGISRTPVREALNRLTEQGMVRTTPASKFVVATLRPEDVNNACDLLVLLDTYLFTRAAEHLSAEDKRTLVAHAEALVRASTESNTDNWREIDRQFHAMIATAARNDLAAKLTAQVRARVQRFWVRSAHTQERLPKCSQEHLAIAEAIAADRPDEIPPLISSHIEHMREGLLGALAQAQAFINNG